MALNKKDLNKCAWYLNQMSIAYYFDTKCLVTELFLTMDKLLHDVNELIILNDTK